MKTQKSKLLFDSHQRLSASAVVGIIAYFILSTYYDYAISFIGAWDAFALCDILLAWGIILRKNARDTVQSAKLQDSGRATILSFLLAAALAMLVAITLLLKTAKHSTDYSITTILFFALLTVAVSWVLVHTVFTIHYAHVFYGEGSEKNKRGLIFPEEEMPAFTDFAYFSFVIGMTFQVSDVQVSSKRMRKLTLAHGIISFLFNTFILALSINLIAGLF
jgi:uncharacterized membrane protein